VILAFIALLLFGLTSHGALADSPPGQFTRRGVAAAVACDECGNGQTLRLYYLGLRPAPGAALADPRLRGALWAAIEPDALAAGEVAALANVSPAVSAIRPDLRASYSPDHHADLAFCDVLLNAAGFPASNTPRYHTIVDLALDPVSLAIAHGLQQQLATCKINIALNALPAELFTARLAAGTSSPVFLASIDVPAGSPYALLERLWGVNSPENFIRYAPSYGPSVEPLLAAARSEKDPNKQASLYHEVNAAVMDHAGLLLMTVLPLVWRYDAIPGQLPPSLRLDQPQLAGTTVTVNGLTLPGAAGHEVARIRWDWGDGAAHDSWFPAAHAYATPGPRRIIVTSYQTDNRWTVRTATVTPVVGGGAPGFTFAVPFVEELALNEWRIAVDWVSTGLNDGRWSAKLDYLQRCRDATGKKLGTATGAGGLIGADVYPLSGAHGAFVSTFHAALTSDLPIAWPVTCEGGSFRVWHSPAAGPADSVIFSTFVPMPTTWYQGVTVHTCAGACTGNW